ncbi:reverse transcriptase domain, reverse transcriptase zinc-binding domain protein, partial [Tanacetum coccineum]
DRLKLTHLSFVDDLIVFSKANVYLVRVLSSALKEFSGVYGLVPNLDKSSIFFGNVPESLKFAIMNILPLAVGVYPVRFLWSHEDLCKGHAKVRWKDVCCLKCQGGLGLSLGEVDCKVCDIVDRGEWLWPESWRNKFPFLFQLPPPLLFRDRKVKVLWKSNNGKVGDFSVSVVWSDLSVSMPKVSWHKLVWFSHNIPRHAFILWLAIKQRLKTQDRIEV